LLWIDYKSAPNREITCLFTLLAKFPVGNASTESLKRKVTF